MIYVISKKSYVFLPSKSIKKAVSDFQPFSSTIYRSLYYDIMQLLLPDIFFYYDYFIFNILRLDLFRGKNKIEDGIVPFDHIYSVVFHGIIAFFIGIDRVGS